MPPKRHPKGPQEGPQEGLKSKRAKSVNLASRVGGSVIFGSRGGPDEAPNGVKIASKVTIGLKIYTNRLEEGSERARKAKQSSMGALRCDLGPPGAG